MKPAFTPGPWETFSVSKRFVVDQKGRLISSPDGFFNGWSYPAEDEALANARLIAAAPDLYDALAWCREGVIDIDLIDRALTKANGETQ